MKQLPSLGDRVYIEVEAPQSPRPEAPRRPARTIPGEVVGFGTIDRSGGHVGSLPPRVAVIVDVLPEWCGWVERRGERLHFVSCVVVDLDNVESEDEHRDADT